MKRPTPKLAAITSGTGTTALIVVLAQIGAPTWLIATVVILGTLITLIAVAGALTIEIINALWPADSADRRVLAENLIKTRRRPPEIH